MLSSWIGNWSTHNLVDEVLHVPDLSPLLPPVEVVGLLARGRVGHRVQQAEVDGAAQGDGRYE